MKENANLVTCTYPVIGMGCSMCVKRVDKALREVEGVENVDVSLEKLNAKITYNPEQCSAELLQQAVQDAGYDMWLE